MFETLKDIYYETTGNYNLELNPKMRFLRTARSS